MKTYKRVFAIVVDSLGVGAAPNAKAYGCLLYTSYPANVSSIQKAQQNHAGEKRATIDFTRVLGTIRENTRIGIYGTYVQLGRNAPLMEWADAQSVHKGKAQLYTVCLLYTS